MRKLIEWAIRRVTGKANADLAAAWTWHYFCTRSVARAYWRTLTHSAA